MNKVHIIYAFRLHKVIDRMFTELFERFSYVVLPTVVHWHEQINSRDKNILVKINNLHITKKEKSTNRAAVKGRECLGSESLHLYVIVKL